MNTNRATAIPAINVIKPNRTYIQTFNVKGFSTCIQDDVYKITQTAEAAPSEQISKGSYPERQLLGSVQTFRK